MRVPHRGTVAYRQDVAFVIVLRLELRAKSHRDNGGDFTQAFPAALWRASEMATRASAEGLPVELAAGAF